MSHVTISFSCSFIAWTSLYYAFVESKCHRGCETHYFCWCEIYNNVYINGKSSLEVNDRPYEGQRRQEKSEVLFRTPAKAMFSILNDSVVSCEAFVKLGKCLPHRY